MITNQSNSIATITKIWTQPRLSRHVTISPLSRASKEMAEKLCRPWGSNPRPCAPLLCERLLRLAFFPAFQRPGVVAEWWNVCTGYRLDQAVAIFVIWCNPDHPVLHIYPNNTGPTARLTARR